MSDPSLAPVLFSPADATIAEYRSRFLSLTIAGVDDKQGLQLVHSARMEVKAARVAVEKKRKDLKQGALDYGRLVDGEARRITEQLEPIETYLQKQEDAVEAEKLRLRVAAEAVRRQKLDARLAALHAVSCVLPLAHVEVIDDAQFALELAEATAEFEAGRARAALVAEAERARLAAEEQVRREEAERLAKERLELEAQRVAQAAQQAELDRQQRELRARADAEAARIKAESDRLAAERAAQEKAAEDERRAKALAKKIAEEKAAKEAAKLEAERRREARRPEAERVAAFAERLLALDVPEGELAVQVSLVVSRAAAAIKSLAGGLVA